MYKVTLTKNGKDAFGFSTEYETEEKAIKVAERSVERIRLMLDHLPVAKEKGITPEMISYRIEESE